MVAIRKIMATSHRNDASSLNLFLKFEVKNNYVNF